MARIYVGNLPPCLTLDQVRDWLASFGAVRSCCLPLDPATGKPRGFAIVQMSRPDALRAIRALQGRELQGHRLRVNELVG